MYIYLQYICISETFILPHFSILGVTDMKDIVFQRFIISYLDYYSFYITYCLPVSHWEKDVNMREERAERQKDKKRKKDIAVYIPMLMARKKEHFVSFLLEENIMLKRRKYWKNKFLPSVSCECRLQSSEHIDFCRKG